MGTWATSDAYAEGTLRLPHLKSASDESSAKFRPNNSTSSWLSLASTTGGLGRKPRAGLWAIQMPQMPPSVKLWSRRDLPLDLSFQSIFPEDRPLSATWPKAKTPVRGFKGRAARPMESRGKASTGSSDDFEESVRVVPNNKVKLRTDSRRAPEPPTSAASTASGASRRVRTEEEVTGRRPASSPEPEERGFGAGADASNPKAMSSPSQHSLSRSPSGIGRKRSASREEPAYRCTCGATQLGEEPCRSCGQKRQTQAEMRKTMILTAKEDLRVSVFKKLQEHNEIHRDELPKGLELCGFVVRTDWVTSICESITKYSTLELEEFLELVRAYEANQDNAYKVMFEEADLDQSGTMEAAELAELLKNLGIEPMSHVLMEVIREVDEHGEGALQFPEFKHLMDLLTLREGFTSSEYELYLEIFGRFDSKNGLQYRDISTALSWLGYRLKDDVLSSILREAAFDGGHLNQREYLRVLQRVREFELQIVRTAMEANGAEETGVLPKQEVPAVLKQLGYDLWDAKAITEAAEQADITEQFLDLGSLWRLLLAYRQREGMRNDELEQIDAAFRQEDVGRGQLASLEVPKAIRDLGYQVSFEAMQSVLRQVDIEDSGLIGPLQFRKVVRMLQERDMALFQQAFDDEDVDARQVLSIPAASRAFANAGFAKCAQPDWTSTEMSLVGIVTRDGFVRACLKHVRMLRQAIIKNGGWTDPEVENLKVLFQKYDLSKSGRICNKEMIQLVEDIVPELAHERSMRPQLLALVREVDQDMVGLNFQDFLRLMALFRAFKDKQRLRKEQQAIKDCGFSHAEVADFRELFLNSLEDSPDLSFDDFRQMIHGITPLGDVLTAQLREIFLAQCKKEADFPDFLLLMKRLLDSDFANIKERSAKPRG
ncbi:unnamed protein product [Effrenium voratum]|uniref:EF-hand domain-containing protein n=1 Tax=Effrenium voratum TaxID=2562239 RepID=A0AA36IHS2_9DINO|nr:unnamed protein product [Effrenium voratum]